MNLFIVENNFINLLLQVGSGSGFDKKYQIQRAKNQRIRPDLSTVCPVSSEMKKKIDSHFRWVGINFDIINHHFMLEFVDSDLYSVQDEINFINPLVQVGSGSNVKNSGKR